MRYAKSYGTDQYIGLRAFRRLKVATQIQLRDLGSAVTSRSGGRTTSACSHEIPFHSTLDLNTPKCVCDVFIVHRTCPWLQMSSCFC